MLWEIIRWLVILSWALPIFFVTQTLVGKLKGKKVGKCKKNVELGILQIPTVGNHETVNKIFERIRKYRLPIPIQCWVIIDEGDDPNKYNADKVVVVPKSFKCLAHAKARVLEYTRRFRLKMVEEGALTANYVVIQSDDDSVVSEGLIREALEVDAEVVIGTVKPRKTSRLGLLMDYERAYTCLHTCLFFTNIGKPIFGHGESTIYTHAVESKLNYEFEPLNGKKMTDVPVMGNEDMYFLHKAEVAGFKVYKSCKSVEISPPLVFEDAVEQRRRWLWGNFNIVYIKRMLPLSHALRFVFVHLSAFVFYPFSQIGIVLSLLGVLRLSLAESLLALVGFVCWYSLRFYSISHVMGLKHGLVGTVLSKLTTTINFVVIVLAVLKGDPKRFTVIRKTM